MSAHLNIFFNKGCFSLIEFYRAKRPFLLFHGLSAATNKKPIQSTVRNVDLGNKTFLVENSLKS